MKKEIRDTREKLYKESLRLREIANDVGGYKAFEIRREQDKLFRKWEFYINILKANDKIDKKQ
jgi:hypothetical protein